jgi:hypothetical protein
MISTDPYRPAVRDMTTNDLPFVIKSSEDLPAARQDLNWATRGKREQIHITTPDKVSRRVAIVVFEKSKQITGLSFVVSETWLTA